MTNIHRLKIAQPFYSMVDDGTKNFEIRKSGGDRYFEAGDYLVLQLEPPMPKPLEARDLVRKVKSIVTCYQFADGLKDNYCVMGLDVPSETEAALVLELESAQDKVNELDAHRCY